MSDDRLSVLRIGSWPHSHGLYSAKSKSFILKGTMAEVEKWKNIIEEAIQQQSNADYMENLKTERLTLLMASGKTPEEADKFLQRSMPFLYKNQSLATK